jgi:hypothetical protein
MNCTDPEPDCASNDTDSCGICGGGNAADLGCGCFEPAPQMYWFDSDGDGFGFGEPNQFCLDNLPEKWVTNDYDLEPDCASNDTDSCGICGGGNAADLGCGCFEPGPQEYWFDDDNDGFGSGQSEFYCLDAIPEDWVYNNIDPEGNCFNPDEFTLMIDDCGECSSEEDYLYADLGCGCFEPAALIYCLDTDADGLGNPGTENDYCLDGVT